MSRPAIYGECPECTATLILSIRKDRKVWEIVVECHSCNVEFRAVAGAAFKPKHYGGTLQEYQQSPRNPNLCRVSRVEAWEHDENQPKRIHFTCGGSRPPEGWCPPVGVLALTHECGVHLPAEHNGSNS